MGTYEGQSASKHKSDLHSAETIIVWHSLKKDQFGATKIVAEDNTVPVQCHEKATAKY